jgi:hypothetical protein
MPGETLQVYCKGFDARPYKRKERIMKFGSQLNRLRFVPIYIKDKEHITIMSLIIDERMGQYFLQSTPSFGWMIAQTDFSSFS